MNTRRRIAIGLAACLLVGIGFCATNPEVKFRWQLFQYGIAQGQHGVSPKDARTWGDPHLHSASVGGALPDQAELLEHFAAAPQPLEQTYSQILVAGYDFGRDPWPICLTALGIVAVSAASWAAFARKRRKAIPAQP